MFTCDSIIDFDNSFATYIVKGFSNFGRFKIESVTTVHEGNLKEEYILLSPVMACDVYGKGDLFKKPPYFFQALFSNSHYKIFRTYLPVIKQDNSCGRIEELFEDLKKCLKSKVARKLSNKSAIIAATMENKQLTAQISFNTKGIDVSVTFPIKHINVNPYQNNLQVETGALAIPNLNNISANNINCFECVFVAFQEFDSVDFASTMNSNTHHVRCSINIYGDYN